MSRLLVQIVLVALGSAAGGLARWSAGLAAVRLLGAAWPYGTFFVNVTGSLFLGWLLTVLAERLPGQCVWLRPDDLRLLFAVGFAGAYTTFSTFEWETHGMARDGDFLTGALYAAGSVVLGLLAIRAGVLLAKIL